MSAPIYPGAVEGRIFVTPGKRGSHQEFWPTVEVTEQVTVIARESWGTRAATYEVVAYQLIDIRNGYTREAIEEAKRLGRVQTAKVRTELQDANPDYMTPPRY